MESFMKSGRHVLIFRRRYFRSYRTHQINVSLSFYQNRPKDAMVYSNLSRDLSAPSLLFPNLSTNNSTGFSTWAPYLSFPDVFANTSLFPFPCCHLSSYSSQSLLSSPLPVSQCFHQCLPSVNISSCASLALTSQATLTMVNPTLLSPLGFLQISLYPSIVCFQQELPFYVSDKSSGSLFYLLNTSSDNMSSLNPSSFVSLQTLFHLPFSHLRSRNASSVVVIKNSSLSVTGSQIKNVSKNVSAGNQDKMKKIMDQIAFASNRNIPHSLNKNVQKSRMNSLNQSYNKLNSSEKPEENSRQTIDLRKDNKAATDRNRELQTATNSRSRSLHLISFSEQDITHHSDLFLIDKNPSKPYIEFDCPRRSRSLALVNRFSFCSDSNSTNLIASCESSKNRKLQYNTDRDHFKRKRSLVVIDVEDDHLQEDKSRKCDIIDLTDESPNDAHALPTDPCVANVIEQDLKHSRELRLEVYADESSNSTQQIDKLAHTGQDSIETKGANLKQATDISLEVIDFESGKITNILETTHKVSESASMFDDNYIPFKENSVSEADDKECSIKIVERNEMLSLRTWERTGFANERVIDSNSDEVFTVMSYNILSQQLLHDNRNLYRNCRPEYTLWSHRWALLQREFLEISPDILTLQEVQEDHYREQIFPWFKSQGFKSVYKKRTGRKCDGCGIFWKESKFQAVEEASVEYHQPGTYLDRDNIGLVCILTNIANGMKLCVATTHLLFNPRRHNIRLAQLQMFLAEIERFSYIFSPGVCSYLPIIITGDFNLSPSSPLLSFLRRGNMSCNTCCMVDHNMPPILGINSYSQHYNINLLRKAYNYNGSNSIQNISVENQRRLLEESSICLYHSEKLHFRQCSLPREFLEEERIRSAGGFGLKHLFMLRSVYKHSLDRLRGAPEVTSLNDPKDTIDYMFYSLVYSGKWQKPVEGNLKLLSRYGLLSASETQKFGSAPSAIFPSDHLPLAAKFVLSQNRFRFQNSYHSR